MSGKPQMIRRHTKGRENREMGKAMHVSHNTVGKCMREYERLQSELEAA